jgi:hypothetical protein
VRGCGTTRFLSNTTFRNAQQAAVAVDVTDLMDALKIEKAILGDLTGAPGRRTCRRALAAALQGAGHRERLCGPQDVAAQKLPLPPEGERQWWYQYYFATERSVLGYDKYRNDFGKLIWRLIWRLASPKWAFDDATFERTAASFRAPERPSSCVGPLRGPRRNV